MPPLIAIGSDIHHQAQLSLSSQSQSISPISISCYDCEDMTVLPRPASLNSLSSAPRTSRMPTARANGTRTQAVSSPKDAVLVLGEALFGRCLNQSLQHRWRLCPTCNFLLNHPYSDFNDAMLLSAQVDNCCWLTFAPGSSRPQLMSTNTNIAGSWPGMLALQIA